MKQLYTLFLLAFLPLLSWGQTTLAPGDIVFVAFNIADDNGIGPTNPPGTSFVSVTPGSIQDDQFQFMLLKPVAANTRIYFTDFGWLSSGGFQAAYTPGPANNGLGQGSAGDGIISWATSTSLAAGTIVRITCKYNLTASVGTVTGEERVTPISNPQNITPPWLSLLESNDPTPSGAAGNNVGDALFAYQAASPRATPTPLAGVRFIGQWSSLNSGQLTLSTSDVPASLISNGMNAAVEINNYTYVNAAKYDCAAQGNITTGFPRPLRNAINTKAKWTIPNIGTPCEGFVYDPTTTVGCLQTSLTGFLPSTCVFTVLELRIVQQPVSRTICADQTTTFSVSAINATDYQWQSSPTGSAPWTNLSNGAVYSGVTSTTLNVLNPTGLNGTFYRVIASETTEPASATSNGTSRLTVNPLPVLTLAAPNICTPASATLTATSGLVSYTYTGSNGFNSTGASNTTQVAGLTAGPYSFTVRARDSNGCSNTATASFNVSDPLPISLSAPAVCEGEALTLTAASGFSSYTYAGSNGFRSTGAASTTTVTGLPANTYTFSVTGITAAGCPSFASTQATVNPTPTVVLGGTVVCGVGEVSLSATSGLSSYTFIGIDGVIASGTSSNVVTATGVASGTQTFTVLVTNASGCSASATVTVDATIPMASAGTNTGATTFCVGNQISLTATGGGTYLWSGPNGFNTIQQNPNISNAQVAATGTYTLVVTATNGCQSTATVALTVNPNPASFTVGGGGLFCPSSQTLIGPENANYTYQWGRSLSGIANPNSYVAFGGTASTQAVTLSGNYRLIVTNEFGCTANDTAAVSIADHIYTGSIDGNDPVQTGRINRFAQVSTCANPKTACPGIFASTGDRHYDAYPLVNKRNVPICVTVGLRSGCGTNMFNVAYLNSFNPAAPCQNFLADPGSSFPGTGFMEVTIPANGTAIVVVHEVNPGAGCSSYTLTADMPRDPAGITMLPGSGTVCSGTAATLVASVADTYAWSGPGISNATSQTLNPAPTAETSYSVALGYGNVGCTASASQLVSIQSVTANVSALPSTTLTCNAPSLTLTASGAASYTFTAPGGSIVPNTNGVAQVNAPGTYTITVGSAAGCTSQTTIAISSDQTAPANASLTASNSGTLTCSITSLTLTASATPTSSMGTSLTYVFRGPSGMVAGSGNTREISAPGTYSVIVTGANGCTALATTTVFSNTTAPTGLALTPTPSSTLTCAQTSLTLTAAGTGVGLTYAFNGPSGALVSTGNSATINTPGTYTVTVTGANGCSATSTTVISQDIVTPTASLTAASLTFCADASLTLVAGTGASYRFSSGATQIGGSTGNMATVNVAGTYSVTVTGANGCTATASISVSTVTVTSLTLVPPSSVSVCETGAVSFTVGAAGANLTYQWFKGNSPISGQTGRVLSLSNLAPADAGTYYVTVTGACGTTSTNPTTLTVRPRPAAPTMAANSFTAILSLTPLPLTPFVVPTSNTLTFSNAGGVLNPPVADISNAGVQSFSVTATDQFGCVSLSTPFSLTVFLPFPPASQTVCRGSRVVMNVLPTAVSYQWFRMNGTVALRLTNVAGVQLGTTTASLTLVSIQTSGSYTCQATFANGSVVTYGPFAVNPRICGSRVAAVEPEASLQVRVAPNPLVSERLRGVVEGAEGQALTLELADQQGRVLQQQQWPEAARQQSFDWDVSQAPGGTLLLRARTDQRTQTIKVLKQ